jgi:hypothetical protein
MYNSRTTTIESTLDPTNEYSANISLEIFYNFDYLFKKYVPERYFKSIPLIISEMQWYDCKSGVVYWKKANNVYLNSFTKK